VGELVLIEAVMLVLFVVNIGWISFTTVSTVLGLFAPPPGASRLGRSGDGAHGPAAADLQRGPRRHRRASPARRCGAWPTGGPGDGSTFSSSATPTSPDVWLAEQALVEAARARHGLGERLFYRHRSTNRERKVGNITDWVERWGGAYPFMLVLDADSLMEADTILELARRLEAAPKRA
jgi:membrane glycosyltransferase